MTRTLLLLLQYIDEITLDTFLADGGDFIGIGGGANLVGVHHNYWGARETTYPPDTHGMESITICDPDTGLGTYSVAYWKTEASANGHHWDRNYPTSPNPNNAISWTTTSVSAAGVTSVAYFADEGSDEICMVKYPYGTGGIRYSCHQ